MKMNKFSEEYRLAQRWFPSGSMAINHPDGLGVAYVSLMTPEKDYWQVVAYRGTAGKPEFNHSFKKREQAEKKVGDWFQSLTAHRDYVGQMRESYNAPHTLKVGDIITNSWGYDQTNVDWYRITRATKHFVWLKPIAAHVEENGFMSGPSVPRIDVSSDDPAQWGFHDLNEPEEQHKATGASVTFRFGSGSKWDGKPRYCSWYA
jgi:hypothetical protein